jgi:23S rRNA pseudouridine1911/1915/1917 synthase
VVGAEEAQQRLDVFLARRLGVPRNRVQRWISLGLVSLNGAPAKRSRVVSEGDTILCSPPPVGDGRVKPEKAELSVLFEDDDLVVLNKPAGLAMHPGAGRSDGTLANQLLGSYPEMAGVGGEGRPGIVHRLDLDTTGVVVAARSDAAYIALSAAFAKRNVEKRYLAACFGVMTPPLGTIDAPIGRHRSKRTEMAVRPDGRQARTDYTTLEAVSAASLVELDLMTGRTHQIRVHLKYAGHPLIGDPVYGEARWKAKPPVLRPVQRDFPRPAQHAWKLSFDHPSSRKRLEFIATPHTDLVELWTRMGGTTLTTPSGDSASTS